MHIVYGLMDCKYFVSITNTNGKKIISWKITIFYQLYAPMALIFPCFFYDNHMSKAMNSRNILCAQGCFFVVNIAVSFHDIYYIKNVKSSCKFFFQHFLIDVFVYLYKFY